MMHNFMRGPPRYGWVFQVFGFSAAHVRPSAPAENKKFLTSPPYLPYNHQIGD